MSNKLVDAKLVGDYNDSIDIIIALMLLIPMIVVLLIVISFMNDNRAYQVSVSQHKNFPTESDLALLSDKMGGFDNKCKNNIRWCYSHKYLDPVFGLCDVNTVEDCYRWIICKRPGICPLPRGLPRGLSQGKSKNTEINNIIDCSKINCRYDTNTNLGA